eukprot:TRINITY_DN438_c1_g1_i2.p1 TRINITY_DN438_c1_g1~~TRINITY_DN438_c1_g1_i2.p1  ORF type:complete len:813 (-),score=120.47 TRINITY_DN438_c1_g1_i2:155-2593(-)
MAAPVVPQSNFEQALAAAHTTFDQIKGSTNRDERITEVMPAKQLNSISRSQINTEWARKVDAPVAANQDKFEIIATDKIFEKLEELFKSKIRPKRGRAREKFSIGEGTPSTQWKILGRDKNFREFYEWATKRANKKKEAMNKNPKTNTSDKKYNPLFGIQGSPGTGKTTMCEEICFGNRIELCSDVDLQKLMGNAIPLLVSFNHNTKLTSLDEIRPKFGLALRMLYTHFIDEKLIDFPSFTAELQQFDFGASQVLSCIQSVEKQSGVIMCVDELLKLSGKNAGEVARSIGSCLDESDNFWCVFSTLGWVKDLVHSVTSSDRKIQSTELNRISTDEMITNFSSVKLNNNSGEGMLRMAIDLVEALPRSCTELFSIWETEQGSIHKVEDFLSYSDELFHPQTLNLIKAGHIKFALGSIKPVDLDTEIDGVFVKDQLLGQRAQTFREAIQQGIYVASGLIDSKALYVVLPPLLMVKWLKINSKSFYAFTVLNHLELLFKSALNMDGQHWERVWLHYLAIERILFPHRTPILFEDLRDLKFSSSTLIPWYQMSEHFPSSLDVRYNHNKIKPESCGLGSLNNPGFDSVILFQLIDSTTVMIITENKFSDPNLEGTVTSLEHILKKSTDAKEALSKIDPSSPYYGIDENNIFYFFAAYRNATNDVTDLMLLLQKSAKFEELLKASKQKHFNRQQWFNANSFSNEIQTIFEKHLPSCYKPNETTDTFDAYKEITHDWKNFRILMPREIRSCLPPSLRVLPGLLSYSKFADNSQHNFEMASAHPSDVKRGQSQGFFVPDKKRKKTNELRLSDEGDDSSED